MAKLPDIECFSTKCGAKIYRIPCEVFPGLIGFAHLILDRGPPLLMDTGSGFGPSNKQLWEGLEAIGTRFGSSFRPEDIRVILLTHGHIDHFGGLPYFQERLTRSSPEIWIHALDHRVLTAYAERVVVATRQLRLFLELSGVEKNLRNDLIETYSFSKQHMVSAPQSRPFRDGETIHGLEVIHVPGHCPGQVCLRMEEVLFTADHVLPTTTPHQSPECIMPSTGLDHYLSSLTRVEHLEGIELALGGHEEPMQDFSRRVGAIRDSHQRKLCRVMEYMESADSPLTVWELKGLVYPRAEGFHSLLALEETGAHVEYLYQHGQLAVTNLDEVEHQDNPVIRYRPA